MARTDIFAQLEDMRARGEIDAEEHALAIKYAKEEQAKFTMKVAKHQASFANMKPWYERTWLVWVIIIFGAAAIKVALDG